VVISGIVLSTLLTLFLLPGVLELALEASKTPVLSKPAPE
jgi:Cu/Ag efflux pump CusA